VTSIYTSRPRRRKRSNLLNGGMHNGKHAERTLGRELDSADMARRKDRWMLARQVCRLTRCHAPVYMCQACPYRNDHAREA
jgi:hypothetical protein